jgi:hypothetical protein
LSRDFVVYHKTNERGPLDTSTFSAETDKNAVHGTLGERIWLISGEGKSPMTFFLEQTFVVDEVTRKPKGSAKKFLVTGRAGRTFRPRVSIRNEPWFGELFRKARSFESGLFEVKSNAIRIGLAKLLERKP